MTLCLRTLGQHDRSYRLFFTHLPMIQDFLVEILGATWVDRLDLASGVLVSNALVHSQHKSRQTDLLWKFDRKDGGKSPHVYILLEFQSRPDPTMPVRLMGYKGLLYQQLLDTKVISIRNKLPPILLVVAYTGAGLWNRGTELGSLIADLDPTAEQCRPQLRFLLVDVRRFPRERLEALNSPVADLIRIEQSRDWSEVQANLGRLRQSVTVPSLRKAFESWLQSVILPRFKVPEEISAHINLEEMETMLAESIDRWDRQILRKGRKEGQAQLLLRQLHLKLGPLSPEVEKRVLAAGSGRLLKWSERILTAECLEDVFSEKR